MRSWPRPQCSTIEVWQILLRFTAILGADRVGLGLLPSSLRRIGE